MRYMVKMVNGQAAIYSASGLTMAEEALAVATGWVLYWTTDRTAHRDGLKALRSAAR